MAAAFDAVGPSASGASSLASATLSWTHTPAGVPTAVVVGVALGATSTDAGAVLSVTYGGTAMTALTSPEHANNATAGYIQLFGLASPPSGPQTVAVTSAGGNVPTSLAGGSVSYTATGLTTGTAFGATAVAAGAAPPGSVSLPGTGSSNLVFGAVCDGSGGEAATSGTLRYKNDASSNSAAGNAAGSDVVSSSGTVTLSWSFTTDWWSAAAVEVLAGTSPAAVQIQKPQPGGKRRRRHVHVSPAVYLDSTVTPPAPPDFTEAGAGSDSLNVPFTVPFTEAGAGSDGFSTGPAVITGLAGGAHGYFTDQFGSPRLVWGIAAWGLCGNVGRWTSGAWQSDYDTFTSTLNSQGLTAVYCAPMVTVHNGGLNNGAGTFDSLFPFQGGAPSTGVTGANPSTGLTSAYWARIDYFLNSAKAQGVTVFLNAVGYDTDFDGGTAGPLAGKSSAEFQAYGAALGARYAAQPNIVWLVADDYFGGNDGLLTAFLTGLRGAGDTHPITIENMAESTSRNTLDTTPAACAWGTSNAQFNFTYSYNAIYYGIEKAYTADGTVPVIAGDGYFYQGGSTYAGGSGSFAYDRAFRQDAWHALSSGARGKIHGDESTWQWASTAQAAQSAGWFWVNNAKNIRTVVEGLAGWQNLIPDTASALVTAGRGTHASAFASGGGGGQYEVAFTDSYVTASVTADGTLALVYLSHGTTITVNTALLATGWTATWVDPVTGATSSAGTGPTFNSTAKGSNSQGDPDWVLVFQAPAGSTVPVALAEPGAGAGSLGVMPGLAEAGTSADALGITAVTPVALTDSGTEADALTVVQPTGLAETGAGTTGLGVLPGLTEPGAGADVLGVSQPAGLAEAGTGLDALLLAQPAGLTEAGTTADVLGVTAQAGLTEPGTGLDGLGVTAGVGLAEAGTGTDGLAQSLPVAFTEAGGGSDSAGVMPGLTEAGGGTDSLVTSQVAVVSLTEPGHADDAVSVVPVIPLPEAGTSTDSLGIAPGLTEAGSGDGTLTLVQPTGLSEPGTGSGALGTMPGLTDAGAGADALTASQLQVVPLTDAGAGADSLTAQSVTPVAFTDSGHAADVLALGPVGVTLTEPGAGGDVLALGPAPVALTDTGTGTGTLGVLAVVAVALTDTGAGTGLLTAAFPVPLTDAGHAAEALTAAQALLQPLTGLSAGQPRSRWAAGPPGDTGIGAAAPHSRWTTGEPHD